MRRAEHYCGTQIADCGERKGQKLEAAPFFGGRGAANSRHALECCKSCCDRELIYGVSPAALFRRGGGGRKLFPRGRQGARRSTFAQSTDSKAGSGGRSTVIRPFAAFSRPDRSGPLFDRLRTANFGLDRRCPPMRRRIQGRGRRQAGSGRNSYDRAICAPGVDREIPKTLSGSDAGNRGGRDRRHHSAGGSWRARRRVSVHLPAKSNSATRIFGQRTIACAGPETTSPGKEGSGRNGRSQIAKVSAPPRDALPLATGESPARGPSSPAGDSAGRQPARNDRQHGRGCDRRLNCAPNDGETPSHARMRQSAVRSAGSGAGTESSLQPASISEQSGRSVPSGSCDRPFIPRFIHRSQREAISFYLSRSSAAARDNIGQTARIRITPKRASSGK